MMKSNFHKGALVLMALLLCLAAAPSGLAEEEGLSLRLDAEILLTGTVPAAAETYTVRMTADNGRNPMPGGQAGGSYDLHITGAGIESFPAMTFDALGIYTYTIEQLPGSNALCHYDARVYQLTVSVVNAESSGLAMEVALRSRGTPRIANRMLRRVRDFAQIRAGGVITLEVARQGMDLLDVDELGLEKLDRAMLETMIDKFGGGPVGLETLSAMTGEDASTIEDVYEPYLMQLGFLTRTPRGRVVMPAAYEHLGRKPQTPPDEGEQLRI